MRTAVVTDSNSGISKSEAEALQIYMVPMPVIIDGEVYYEEKDLTQEQFYEYLTGGRNVTTSQPSPGEVLELWEEVFEAGYDEIVYIPMSSAWSESCSTAKSLAQEFDGRVQVVDNRRISVTQKLSVLDALHLVGQGYSAAEIRSRLEESANDCVIYVAVDTLEFLKKGGRVSSLGAAFGTVLNIKPILQVQGGKIDAFAKVRGMKKAEAKMLSAVHEEIEKRFGGKTADLRIMIAGSDLSEEQKEEWKRVVSAEFPEMEIVYDPLALSIGCHVGPGVFGIAVSRVMGSLQ